MSLDGTSVSAVLEGQSGLVVVSDGKSAEVIKGGRL
jgi:hypothetical protein